MRVCRLCHHEMRGIASICRVCQQSARGPRLCRDCRQPSPVLTASKRLCDACRAAFYVKRSEQARQRKDTTAGRADVTVAFWARVTRWEQATGQQHPATVLREREANDWTAERVA